MADMTEGWCIGGVEIGHRDGAALERDFGFGVVRQLFEPAMHAAALARLELKADLVLLAMGFVHPVHEGLLKKLGVSPEVPVAVLHAAQGYEQTTDVDEADLVDLVPQFTPDPLAQKRLLVDNPGMLLKPGVADVTPGSVTVTTRPTQRARDAQDHRRRHRFLHVVGRRQHPCVRARRARPRSPRPRRTP